MDEDDNGKFRLERVKSRMGGGGGGVIWDGLRASGHPFEIRDVTHQQDTQW